MCLEDTVRIPLRARDGSVHAYAIVDAADAEWLNRRRWHWNSRDNYAARTQHRNGRGWSVAMHREILGLKPGDGMEGDHINRDRLDNRRSNLRAIPKAGNRQNLPKHRDGSSQYRGVSWDRLRSKWMARCGRTHLGRFDTEEEAATVAREARGRLLPYAVD